MGNTDKFDSIANIYDNTERHHIAKVASDAIKEYLGETKSRRENSTTVINYERGNHMFNAKLRKMQLILDRNRLDRNEYVERF